jgi:hypothetical protein
LNKKDLIKKYKDQAYYNLMCYSQNLGMTIAKQGFVKEWLETQKEIEILGSMYAELEKNEMLEFINHAPENINFKDKPADLYKKNAMKKIKLFVGYDTKGYMDSDDLKKAETQINEFIKDKDLVDIMFSSTRFTYDFAVIYEIKE